MAWKESSTMLVVFGVSAFVFVMLLVTGAEACLPRGAVFTFYSLPTCPYCISAMPEWEILTDTAPPGVRLEHVDVSKEPGSSRAIALRLTGFPSFVLSKGGETIRYTGERTEEAFASFLRQHIKG